MIAKNETKFTSILEQIRSELLIQAFSFQSIIGLEISRIEFPIG
jgi:hypothetical protein